jgi:hypothetical protein
MRPTTATDGNVFDFQALLNPGTVFEHPKDVVTHPALTMAEKRAILASWASDASAIASCPALRALVGHETHQEESQSAAFPSLERRRLDTKSIWGS